MKSSSAVPGLWRFTWLLFMRSVELRELLEEWGWDIGRDSSLWSLYRRRWREDDRDRRWLVRRFTALLFVLMPAATFALCGLLQLAGLDLDWKGALSGVVIGVVFGVVFGLFFGSVGGVVFGTVSGVAGGVAFGLAGEIGSGGAVLGEAAVFGIVFGIVVGAVFGIVIGVVELINVVLVSVFGSLAIVVVSGVVISGGESLSEEIEAAFYFSLVFLLTYFRLPIYLAEALLTTCVTVAPRFSKARYSKLARLLPFRWHGAISFPLPFLQTFLTRVALEDEELAQRLITEAARSPAQKKSAQGALYQLQAEQLERAARERYYARTAELDLPFLAGVDGRIKYVFRPFQSAAEDLLAAEKSRNHPHRRRVLKHAADTLRKAEEDARSDPRSQVRSLVPALRRWSEAVAEAKAALARAEAAEPQVPLPFVAGPVLQASDRGLFRGRNDLIGIISNDLVGDRRGSILLTGQRRIGKSSLISMLPAVLGGGTEVVSLNFQQLSGSHHRAVPHCWVAEEIVKAWPGVPAPDCGPAWGDTLAWLRDIEAGLKEVDRRMLITVDEIERLHDGIREGWTTTNFLDFLRAAGDVLVRIRFLLATAYTLPRLGPHWVDRLINIQTRQLRPLSPTEAEDLIRKPEENFPDIYPPGGVERIIEVTHGHPYLVQLVCDVLCRHLNESKRLEATPDDIDTAIDDASDEATALFHDLWRERSEEERHILSSLAMHEEVGEDARRLLRSLKQEGYVVDRDGRPSVMIPMLADWIAENT